MVLYDCKKVSESSELLDTGTDSYYVSLYVLTNGPDKDVKFTVLTPYNKPEQVQKVGAIAYAYKGRDGNYYLETRFYKGS